MSKVRIRRLASMLSVSCAAIAMTAIGANAAPDGERVGTWDPAPFIQEGDLEFYVTQEHGRAARAASSVFYLRRDGAILRVAKPNAITTPRGARSDGAGGVIFADFGKPAIMRLGSDGKLTSVVSGGLTGPRDVAVDAKGNLAISNFESYQNTKQMGIYFYDQSSKSLRTVHRGSPLMWPHGIDIESNGNFVVAEHSGSILRITPSGQITTVAKGAPLIGPTDIKVQPDGSYLVADNQMEGIPNAGGSSSDSTVGRMTKLFRVTPDGQITTLNQQYGASFIAIANHPAGGWVVLSSVGSRQQGRRSGAGAEASGASDSTAPDEAKKGKKKGGVGGAEGDGNFTGFLFRLYPDGRTRPIHSGAPFSRPAGVAIVQ